MLSINTTAVFTYQLNKNTKPVNSHCEHPFVHPAFCVMLISSLDQWEPSYQESGLGITSNDRSTLILEWLAQDSPITLSSLQNYCHANLQYIGSDLTTKGTMILLS